MFRYITRSTLANERVPCNADGQLELKLKSPWRDGTTHLAISPLEFMQRLAVLTRLTPQPAALRRPNQSIECLEKVG